MHTRGFMSLSFLWAKMCKKIRGSAIINSKIHKTSKIEAGSSIVNTTFDRYSFCGYDCNINNADIGAFCSIAGNVVISGGNIATECIFPSSWQHSAMDALNLKAIHKKFGIRLLKNFPIISFYQYYFYYPFIKKMTAVRPLNLMPYSKEIALERLEAIGYIPYQRKHGESYFTRFFQNHYLPVKFNMDKRKPHLSSLVVSGIITREQALAALKEPLYNDDDLERDKTYLAEKLGITVQQLDEYTNSAGHHYTEYPNWDKRYALLKKVQATISKTLGKNINAYS